MAKQVDGGDGISTDVCDVALLSGSETDGLFLASMDYSGRHFCNTLLLVRAGTSPRLIQRLSVWNLEDVSRALVDLDFDGRRELVISDILTEYGGGKCMAEVPIVYECSATGCVDTKTKYSDYLADRLDSFEIALSSLNDEQIRNGKRECLASQGTNSDGFSISIHVAALRKQ